MHPEAVPRTPSLCQSPIFVSNSSQNSKQASQGSPESRAPHLSDLLVTPFADRQNVLVVSAATRYRSIPLVHLPTVPLSTAQITFFRLLICGSRLFRKTARLKEYPKQQNHFRIPDCQSTDVSRGPPEQRPYSVQTPPLASETSSLLSFSLSCSSSALQIRPATSSSFHP